MIEAPVLEETKSVTWEDPKALTLEEILPIVSGFSVYDKLILIRILADELATENNPVTTIPPGVYEFYTPYDIEGITDEMIERFEALPEPAFTQDAY